MSQLQIINNKAEAIERVVIGGDLSKLNAEERVNYYKLVCESVGLNPLTKPFEYIMLNGKLTLYARKDATDQLRQNHQVSITIASREVVEGCYVVTARASFPNGRTDESIGAVPIETLKGEPRANAMMKCETKAKRRVTLSICGLGMLDELEIETIPSAKPEPAVVAEPKTFTRPAAVQDSGGKTPAFSGKGTPGVPNGSERSEPTPPERQPGEDDEAGDHVGPLADALAKKLTIENEVGMKENFSRAFKDALPKHLQRKADELRHQWLGLSFFLDKDGNPSSGMILKAEFPQWKQKACEWARMQK